MKPLWLNLLGILSLLLTLTPLGGAQSKPADDATLRVTCFNIRHLTEKDGPNHWTLRRDLFFDTLTADDPDLIGLQEVLHAQAQEIRARLAGHEFAGVGRNDGKQAGEYAPILFRRARFDKLADGHFWLSDTPDQVGSKGWDANAVRMVSWVKLSDRNVGGRAFLCVNTHWDHIGRVARLESAKLLRRKLAELAPSLPVIVTGDFNCTEDDEPYAALLRPAGDAGDGAGSPKLIDAYRAAHPQRDREEATFNGFKPVRIGSRIDWILHTPDWETASAQIDRSEKDGRFPSDHYPVRATLRWRASKQ